MISEIMKLRAIAESPVYVGKSKEWLEVEASVAELQKKLVQVKDLSKLITESSQEIISLENKIARAVGASSVMITYAGSTGTSIGTTLLDNVYVASAKNLMNDRVTVNEDSIKFKTAAGKKLLIFLSLDVLTLLDAEEVTSIIAHECGHCLGWTQLVGVQRVTLDLFEFHDSLYMWAINELRVSLDHEIKNNAIVSKETAVIYQSVKSTIEAIITAPLLFNSAITRLVNLVYPRLEALEFYYGYKLIRQIENIFNINTRFSLLRYLSSVVFRPIIIYDNEKLADSYAAAIGYGPALARAVDKITFTPVVKELNKIPFFKYYGLMIDTVSYLIDIMFSTHPLNSSRTLGQLQYLRAALVDIDNPKLKKSLESDIAQLEKLIKDNREDDNFPILEKLLLEAGMKHDKIMDIREVFVIHRNARWTYLDKK